MNSGLWKSKSLEISFRGICFHTEYIIQLLAHGCVQNRDKTCANDGCNGIYLMRCGFLISQSRLLVGYGLILLKIYFNT